MHSAGALSSSVSDILSAKFKLQMELLAAGSACLTTGDAADRITRFPDVYMHVFVRPVSKERADAARARGASAGFTCALGQVLCYP
jgi:hypothetical protein